MNEISFTIANVEKETGLSKDTLRMWERRYGFPAPERDPGGDRVYPAAQVERLRLIKRLIDQKSCSEDAATAQVLGITFEELGIGVARTWGFPSLIVNSMRKLPPGNKPGP